jgi:Mor family transcriptional regulator
MTVFEILNFNKELLKRLSMIGFKLEDCRFIDLYSEYEQMRRDGDKVTYIVACLSRKYKVSERKVYSVIKRFKKDCTAYTV